MSARMEDKFMGTASLLSAIDSTYYSLRGCFCRAALPRYGGQQHQLPFK